MYYEYCGHLKSLLPPPDALPALGRGGHSISAAQMAKWITADLPFAKGWERIPVQRKMAGRVVRLQGRFEDIRRIDDLDPTIPCYWAPLGTLGLADSGLPFKVGPCPVVECAYRCLTDGARPALVWTYPGGLHVEHLAPSEKWRTVACRVDHRGFPKQLDALILRLYSVSRATEAMEIKSLRLRALTAEEKKACARNRAELSRLDAPRDYPILDQFMPLGVHMDAAWAIQLADLLGISLKDYWALALEDIVTHHHNCISLDNMQSLSRQEQCDLLDLADACDMKVVPANICSRPDGVSCEEALEDLIAPHKDAPAVLAWMLSDAPPEEKLAECLHAKQLVEGLDPNHPPAILSRGPGPYPLFASHFPVSGIGHCVTHAPWQIGDVVRTHAPLNKGSHFWMLAPTFIGAADAPEWSTCSELRLMVNLGIACGAKGWFSYTYHNNPIWVEGTCQRSLTGPFLTFSDLWSELGLCMRRVSALAPLLLGVTPQPRNEEWFVTRSVARENARRPPDRPPTGTHRLCGADYEIYYLVSNDVREMATLNITLPPKALRGMEVYDLNDFIQTREWAPMNLERHLEMFPGQSRALLVAKPEVCARWRDVIAARLIADDERDLAFNLALARQYGLNVKPVEKLIVHTDEGLAGLRTISRAHDMLLNLVYESPAIAEVRSKIIEASAAVCACDGALCRLMGRDRHDQVEEFGAQVLPLAREFTDLRLQLRRGHATALARQCDEVARRAVSLLAEVRAAW